MTKFNNGKPGPNDRYYCEKDKKTMAEQRDNNWISLAITVGIIGAYAFLFYLTSTRFNFIIQNSVLVGIVIGILWIGVMIVSAIMTFKKRKSDSDTNTKYNFEILLATMGFAAYTIFIYWKYLKNKTKQNKTKLN